MKYIIFNDLKVNDLNFISNYIYLRESCQFKTVDTYMVFIGFVLNICLYYNLGYYKDNFFVTIIELIFITILFRAMYGLLVNIYYNHVLNKFVDKNNMREFIDNTYIFFSRSMLLLILKDVAYLSCVLNKKKYDFFIKEPLFTTLRESNVCCLIISKKDISNLPSLSFRVM